MTADRATRFAASFVALLAAHQIADYWVQTDHQATNKGRHGSRAENAAGRAACVAHVISYSAVSTAAVAGIGRALRLGASWRGILAGQAISAVSHYWADRRFPLRRLAGRIGKLDYHDRGGNAMLDQSWHIGWLTLAALATAVVAPSTVDR
ncbi:hypothetical protein ALI144C_18255 [Actinosynnema sp. ALI-1.44]|uniref:DUF3307 domain-containing protein n=1 Tax=Actinosynnema sp. ALI-1.44 TaxID=1933779 RepID=UPI00097C3FF3|nr:DUF3307 domain-containing protein [Actinosynnema sp. ALI-1.44]ONI82991.1 hypothetical protein ALI144C_18255 [Actinosynnema sp. ALI-1.44]